jgi:hypothetical protein
MAALEVLALNTTVPRIEAPQTGDTYTMPRAIAIAPEGLTGSAATPSLDVTQTWNTTGTPTAIKLNVTDTASNAASLLMDLRVGGVSKASVNKAGVLTLNNSGTITWTNASDLTFFSGDGYQRVRAYSFWGSGLSAGIGDNGAADEASVHLASVARLGWTSGSNVNTGTYDVFLQRDAANTLAQRRGTNAQTFRIYNTFTDASNYERGKMEWGSNALKIGTEKAGTGTARALELQTDGTTRMTLDASGNLGIGTSSPGVRLDVDGAFRGRGDGSFYGTGDRLNIFPLAAASGAVVIATNNTNTAYAPLNLEGSIVKITIAGVEAARIVGSGNLGLGTSTFGTSAATVFSIASGTEPSTGPADTVQFFSVDRSAGNTIPGIYCEGTGVTDAAITNVTVTNKIAIKVNGTVYYLLATTSAA